MQPLDTDTWDYFPIRDGLKGPSIGLKKLPFYDEEVKNKIFQFDEHFPLYQENKISCRTERLSKYYQRKSAIPAEVTQFLLKGLYEQWAEIFTLDENRLLECKLTGDRLQFSDDWDYLPADSKQRTQGPAFVDAWDAIACQVQEDLVLHGISGDSDEAKIVHLCHANGWSAEGAIGSTFDVIHQEVPDVKKIMPNSRKILDAILSSSQSMERVGALQYRTSPELNRHPEISRDDLNVDFKADHKHTVYLRFERQTVNPFPGQGCFLFTIRTFITDLNQRKEKAYKWDAFKETVRDPKQGVKCSDFIRRYHEDLEAWIQLKES